MRTIFLFILMCTMLLSTQVHANLCKSVRGTNPNPTSDTKKDVDFYQELFPDGIYHGKRKWNEVIVQCNRQRDTKGNQISKVTASGSNNADKRTLKSSDLNPKVIRGHYNFFGTLITQLKYVYVLSKQNGVWTMILPYKPIMNEVVEDRVDFNFSHAGQLYEASQVVNPSSNAKVLTLKSSPQSIATTLCRTSTYFPGKEGKYDNKGLHKRDPENKFISLGKIEYKYKKDGGTSSGCRVNKHTSLYWRSDSSTDQVSKVKPQDWILDNFVRTSEDYWTIPGVFELKLLMKGRNDPAFPKSTRDLLQNDDHLTVRFANKFLPYGFNQMYKSNIIQFNNFSTMTTDGTYWHEVGHAFGLDDEYGKVKEKKKTGELIFKDNGCESDRYSGLSSKTYQMCDAGASEKRTIYHYLAVSRYITKQKECNEDSDCLAGEFCKKGIDLKKNQCLPKKAENETCAAVGGGHQCKSGKCKFSRCYTPKSVAMGGTCYNDDACKAGKCSAIDGTRGTCVCKKDSDCGTGKWCDGGLDTKKNQCKNKLKKGEKCGKAGSVGNNHKCKSGKCSGFPKYVCK